MNKRRSNPPRHRITSVYTRQGDAGRTGLVGGRDVSKNDPRVRAYGTVDELQVTLGGALDELAGLAHGGAATALPSLEMLVDHLLYLQNLLFTLNGDLATRIEDRWANMPLVTAETVSYLEGLLDALNAKLPPLKDFVLPGGHPAVTALHHGRVVCRRAEREIVALAEQEALGEVLIPFVNRLSDVLFVMARVVARELAEAGLAIRESIWVRDRPPPPFPG